MLSGLILKDLERFSNYRGKFDRAVSSKIVQHMGVVANMGIYQGETIKRATLRRVLRAHGLNFNQVRAFMSRFELMAKIVYPHFFYKGPRTLRIAEAKRR